MIVIGVAGGIASGKTTIAQLFRKLGARILDADNIGHELLQTDTLRGRIRLAFGESVFTREGDVDRRTLGRIIFSSDDARNTLNRLVRPAIRAEIRRQIALIREDHQEKVIVVDAPLLVDTGPTDLADIVILVTAPAALRKERLIHRNNLSKHEAEQRIAAQVSDTKQARWADYVLENTGTRNELIEKARALWECIVS